MICKNLSAGIIQVCYIMFANTNMDDNKSLNPFFLKGSQSSAKVFGFVPEQGFYLRKCQVKKFFLY